MKFYLLTTLAIFGFTAATVALAAKTITVRTYVAKEYSKGIGIIATGFSVDGKGKGGLGASTTKSGPAGKRYSFGIRSANYGDVSCGSRVLMQNSTVVLYWNNKTHKCMNKVFLKK